jgi:hypothetical protein
MCARLVRNGVRELVFGIAESEQVIDFLTDTEDSRAEMRGVVGRGEAIEVLTAALDLGVGGRVLVPMGFRPTHEGD